MKSKWLRGSAFLANSLIFCNVFAGCNVDALWTGNDFWKSGMSVFDAVCSHVFGFEDINKLKQIAEPLTKAYDRVMYELNRLGNFGNTNNLFKALREQEELIKMYGWAEEALDDVRSECLEWISGNKKLDTSAKGRFFLKDLDQEKNKTI